MTDPTSRDLDALSSGSADLDGHTVEELADYLDRDRTPPDPSIDDSPACRRAIAALERLHAASASFLAEEGEAAARDDLLVAAVMRRIAVDSRAGADVVLERTAQGDEVVMTEGALRAIVRDVGDGEPGVLIGGVRLRGTEALPGGSLTVELDLVVAHGVRIPAATARLRTAIRASLSRHTGASRVRVDVVVRDVLVVGRRS